MHPWLPTRCVPRRISTPPWPFLSLRKTLDPSATQSSCHGGPRHRGPLPGLVNPLAIAAAILATNSGVRLVGRPSPHSAAFANVVCGFAVVHTLFPRVTLAFSCGRAMCELVFKRHTHLRQDARGELEVWAI